MRITRFEFEDTQKGWRLKPVVFSDLTLLVGVSGVGKTRILRAISTLASIAQGKSRPGKKWEIHFVDEDSRECVWSGECEKLDDFDSFAGDFDFVSEDEDDAKKKARIFTETVSIDRRLVINRKNDQIELDGAKMPKLSPYESVISLFKEEDEIKPIAKSFDRIVHSDRTEQDGFLRSFAAFHPDRLRKKFSDIDAIKQSSNQALTKLYLAEAISDRAFEDVRDRFISVFPNTENVSFGSYKDEEAAAFFGNASFVQIKERGVDDPIPQRDISSGMMRTLAHLAELYLSPAGTVILIDEFENSLGVNCIDAVTEDLLDTSSSIQFIMTSHHPYIINNVGSDFWKIVCRVGSDVETVDASELGIGASSHDAFLQLMNSDKYLRGVSLVRSQ